MELRLRLALAASLCLSPLAPLSARLVWLQVMQHGELTRRASGEFNRSSEEAAPRADLLDRHGRVLAQSVPVWAASVDRKGLKDPAALAARLGPLVGRPVSEVARLLAGPGRFLALAPRLSFEEAAKVAQARLEGVRISPSQERFYPNGSLARGVLGQVAADGRGQAGVELALEARLAGTPNRFKLIRDGSGKAIYKAVERESPPPEAVRLTLDRAIQYYSEEILGEAVRKHGAKGGLLAVQDPATGDILAMAATPADPLRNPLIQDTYEPGSTFKVVAAAAALEGAVVADDELLNCEGGSFALAPGVIVRDHEPQGLLNLAGVIEHSSNIGMIKIVEKVGAQEFYRTLRAFGFANKTGIPLPGETAGELRPLSEMGRVALSAASYGYGIGVSPLQVLSAYSAVANGGTLWEPRIILDGKSPAKVRRVASARSMAKLSAMLEGVIERGTGAAARIAGYRVAGKTGTSRKFDPVARKYSTSLYNASFVGYLPAGEPRWTILVVIEDPKSQYYGAQVAAPVFAKLGRQLLALSGVPPEKPLGPRLASAVLVAPRP